MSSRRLTLSGDVPFYVLVGGSRNGERVVTDVEMPELRLPSRAPRPWRAAAPVERYRTTQERRDGFVVARIVTATTAMSTGWATT